MRFDPATETADPATLEGLPSAWLPFTPNRYFQQHPKIVVGAQGAYYQTSDGRQLFDALSGLWCCPLGHGHPKIVEALATQAATLDYAPAFQLAHPGALKLAGRIADLAPAGLNRVFFANSGSESVDTAIKMAIGYHRLRGEGARYRIIGRERGYHGVGFGGISVGGMVNNRKFFAAQLPGVDHLPHTHDLAHNAYSRGEPEWGAHLADDLERIVALHDASNIAAVIVEPVAGSTGVLLPPKGYLKRLREICTKHGILLVFDEVITGFGRLGAPFAAEYFGVIPDMITMAKGLTNGAVPMGAVAASRQIYDAFMHGPEGAIELFHGYTYSAHPVACAAGLATQQIYRRDGLLTRARDVADYWADAVHSLKGLPHVIDLRNLGLIGAIELESIPGRPGARAYDVFVRAFEKGLLIRVTGDIIALSPPLIIEKQHIDELFGKLADVLRG